MSIVVQCHGCGKKLQGPDSAAGKRVKCPHCGTAMQLPEAEYDAEEIADTPSFGGLHGPPGGFHDEDLMVQQPAASEPAASEPPRRPCPACGEMIVAQAAKCRFCGEIFDPVLKKKEKRNATDDDLSTGDWVVAVLCSGIGCIAGIVWLIQGKGKGPKMIGVSLLAAIMWSIIRVFIEVANQ